MWRIPKRPNGGFRVIESCPKRGIMHRGRSTLLPSIWLSYRVSDTRRNLVGRLTGPLGAAARLAAIKEPGLHDAEYVRSGTTHHDASQHPHRRAARSPIGWRAPPL